MSWKRPVLQGSVRGEGKVTFDWSTKSLCYLGGAGSIDSYTKSITVDRAENDVLKGAFYFILRGRMTRQVWKLCQIVQNQNLFPKTDSKFHPWRSR